MLSRTDAALGPACTETERSVFVQACVGLEAGAGCSKPAVDALKYVGIAGRTRWPSWHTCRCMRSSPKARTHPWRPEDKPRKLIPMLFEIRHETRFVYDNDVFLEPQTVRLTPRNDAHQRLISFELEVQPSPAGASELVDLDGDRATVAWFEGATGELSIHTVSRVETLRSDAFQFPWLGSKTLPMAYDMAVERALDPFRHWTHAVQLKTFSERLAAESTDAQDYVLLLAKRIQETCEWIDQEPGESLEPRDTLAKGKGSSRGLAMLYIDLARAAGFAARFVSGYLAGGGANDLHAWAEVYLPGGGWLGFDSSTGQAAAGQHIAVASATNPKGATPVTGHYRGEQSRPAPDTRVLIREI